MTRTVKGTKYEKVQGRAGRFNRSGKVHLVFWVKSEKRFVFVCGKRAPWDAYSEGSGVPDDTRVTCLNCIKHAPDIVKKMEDPPKPQEDPEDYPSIMDFQ